MYTYADSPLKGTKIECCAILYNGICYMIPAPASHKDVADYIEHYLNTDYDEERGVLGFLTDRSEFLTLTEGFVFAADKGQVL